MLKPWKCYTAVLVITLAARALSLTQFDFGRDGLWLCFGDVSKPCPRMAVDG